MNSSKMALVLGAALLGATQVQAGDRAAVSSPLTLVAQAHDHDHPAEAGAKGKGVVNMVDAAAHKVNVSHEPIPSLGWPAMKMDFAVAPSVDLKTVQAGTQVEFTVGKNKAGLPEIQSIQPAKK